MASDYHTIDLSVDLPLTPSTAEHVAIYALDDPRTGQLRYIGKTDDPGRRLSDHLLPWRLKKSDHRACWLKLLRGMGLKPRLRVLTWVVLEDWQEAERVYITEARRQGCDLVNTAPGGRGVMLRQKHTPAVRAKISALTKGKPKSAHMRAALSAARKGKPASPAGVAKMIAHHRTPEYRAWIAEVTRRGHAANPEGLRRRQAKRLATLARKKAARAMPTQLPLPF